MTSAVANVSQLLETQLSPMSVFSVETISQPGHSVLLETDGVMDGATLVTLEHSTLVERDGIYILVRNFKNSLYSQGCPY